VNGDNNGKVHVEHTTDEAGIGAVVGAVGGAFGRLIFTPPNPPATLAVLAQMGRTGPDTLGIHSSAVPCVAIPHLSSPLGRRCSPPNTVSEDAVSAAPNGHRYRPSAQATAG